MKEKTKQRKKNVKTYLVCLLVAITMWIGQRYNRYIEEQSQIKKICQIEKKVEEKLQKNKTEAIKKKTPPKQNKEKKDEEQKISEQILSDTLQEINDTTVLQ